MGLYGGTKGRGCSVPWDGTLVGSLGVRAGQGCAVVGCWLQPGMCEPGHPQQLALPPSLSHPLPRRRGTGTPAM